MRFSLRTLIVVMLVGGPALAGAWWGWQDWKAKEEARRAEELAARVSRMKVNFSSGPGWYRDLPVEAQQDLLLEWARRSAREAATTTAESRDD